MKYYNELAPEIGRGLNGMLPLRQKTFYVKTFLLILLSVGWVRITESSEQLQKSVTTAETGAITVQQETGAIKVSITFNPSVPPPRISRLVQPERLVFDFAGTVPKSGYQRTSVNMSSLIAIRTALFRTDAEGRPVTRVVFDLSQRSAFQASSSADRYIVTVFDRIGRLPPGAAHPGAQATVGKTELPAPATTSPQKPISPKLPVFPKGENALNNVSVSDHEGLTSVVLDFQRPTKPITMQLEQPKRFVLDFPGIGFGAWSNKCSLIKANTASLRAIRCSLFKAQPATVRIVLDETTAASRPQVTLMGASVRIQYSDQSLSRTSPASRPLPAVNAAAPPQSGKPLLGVATQAPIVSYENSLLTIEANNAILADVMYAISEKTGASIQLPMSNAMLDRVTLKMGPVKPRQVLATVLEGSGFTYFIIEDNSGHLQKVILTPR
jgi:hypothetical protein